MFVALPLRLGVDRPNKKKKQEEPQDGDHQLTSEDIIIQIQELTKEKTVLGLLRALTQIVGHEAALCKGVLGVLTEHQRSLGGVDLAKNTLSGVAAAVKEHGRTKKQLEQDKRDAANNQHQPSAGSSSTMQVMPPRPDDRAISEVPCGASPATRFADMTGTVEACISPEGRRCSDVTALADRVSSKEKQDMHKDVTARRRPGRFDRLMEQTSSRATERPIFPDAYHGSMLKRIFLLFEDSDSSWLSKVVEFLIVSTILVSTVSFLVESHPRSRERPAECAALLAAGLPLTVRACEPHPHAVFYPIEAVCIIVFTVDYVIRILLAHTQRNEDTNWLRATINYVRQPLNVIDLLAIAPFYIELVLGGQVGIAGVLRLARTLRLFKLLKRIPMISIYVEVLEMSGQPLGILLFFGVIIVTVFGALIYYAEGQTYSVDSKFISDPAFRTGVYARPSQDGSKMVVTPFHSIPYSLWWVCVTVATVGYGDYVPTSVFGKTIGIASFYCGIIFLALPISILGQNFAIVYAEYLENHRAAPSTHRNSLDRISSMRRSRTGMPTPTFLPQGNFRTRLFLLLEDPASSFASKVLSITAMVMILISTVSFIVESMPIFKETPKECAVDKPTVEACEPVAWPLFSTIEVVCVAYFTVDYFGRIFTVHSVTPEECGLPSDRKFTAVGQTFMYFKQLLNLIDLFAIIPFYVELGGGGGGGASVLRVLRLVRVFRVLRVPKLKSCAEMFIAVGTDAFPALSILVGLSLLACIICSSCIYIAEGTNYSVDAKILDFLEDYPMGAYVRPTANGYKTEVSPYSSIPYAFWWFFTTATTVGYGDDYPTTTAGRIIGVFVFMIGVVLLAMPITIVGGSFAKYYEEWVNTFCVPAGEDDVEQSTPERKTIVPAPKDGTAWQEGHGWLSESPPPLEPPPALPKNEANDLVVEVLPTVTPLRQGIHAKTVPHPFSLEEAFSCMSLDFGREYDMSCDCLDLDERPSSGSHFPMGRSAWT